MIHNNPVLILNKNEFAVGVRPLFRAMVKFAAGQYKALDITYPIVDGKPDYESCEYYNLVDFNEWLTLPIREYDNWITTPKTQIRMPTIMVAINYKDIPKHKLSLTKRAIWERDRGICQVTGKPLSYKNGSIDHIIPKDRGGKNTWENVALMDLRLNNKKGNKTLEEMGWKLIKKPSRPNQIPVAFKIKAEHPSWKMFLPNERND